MKNESRDNNNIFERIRSRCRWVSEQARYVHVVQSGLADYAASLPDEVDMPQTLDPDFYFFGDDEQTAAYLVTLNAVNFGSGYFPCVQKRPGMSGFFTMASGLKEQFDVQGSLTDKELRSMTKERCGIIFKQNLDHEARRELMSLFAESLRDLGQLLNEKYDGSFSVMIRAAEHSAEKLLRLLSEMKFFRDQATYKGYEVPFYKRAQITAADLAMAFNGEGLGGFYDLDELTIFADNLVPHVLRIDGILLYEQGLLEKIEREELIPAGSEEEIEIRASGLHAVELLSEQRKKMGRPVPPRKLDYFLWYRGQDPDYKMHPRHRCRCVYY